MTRCKKTGKLQFRDAGVASRYVDRGERRGLYTCPHCGHLHLTKRLQNGVVA